MATKTIAGDYQKVAQYRLPQVAERETSEARYWKKFANPVIDTHTSGVTHVHCSPADPHDYAVSTSTRIIVYNGKTGKVKRQLTRFQNQAYSGQLRKDGKLLVAGGEDPRVQVFDISSRSVLRSMRGHTMPIHCTQWSPDATHLLSCSDDKTVRYWDLTNGSQVHSLTGHTDYVRCASVNPNNFETWATGSYDHTVCTWDMRSGGKPTMAMSHGEPVESVLMLPGGGLLLSTGGNKVKVWDVMSGGRLLTEFSYHQKTITSICCDGTGTRILTGSLDGMVKVYDVSTFKVTSSLKYGGPILGMGITADNRKLVVGMSTGELNVKTRQIKSSEIEKRKADQALRGGSHRHFVRGGNVTVPDNGDLALAKKKKQKLNPHDKFIKQFRYKQALNAALDSKQPETVASVLEELVQRSSLELALSGRDEETLEPLLSFLNRYVTNPRFAPLLIDVCSVLLSLYTTVIGHSVIIDELFQKLAQQLKQELKLQHQLHKIQGTLDLLFAAAK